MPSIQDIADQINAKLDSISANTGITASNTANILIVTQDIRSGVQQVNGQLSTITNVLGVGFANLSQGLFAIAELQRVTNALLEHNRHQNDTIICELTHANEQLCGISRKFTYQLELGKATLASVKRIEGIAERTHAAAAADYDRLQALQRNIEECCPPDRPPPEPCPEPCPRPDYNPHRPAGQDWQPLPNPQRPDPVG
jgi:hypothetical protein